MRCAVVLAREHKNMSPVHTRLHLGPVTLLVRSRVMFYVDKNVTDVQFCTAYSRPLQEEHAFSSSFILI
jgi:hypothetical protein